MSDSTDTEEVEPVARTVIIEREVHRLSTAGKIAVGALVVAALAGFGATIWGRVGAEHRAAEAERLNTEIITELAEHSHASDCRADAVVATAQAQAHLLTTLADALMTIGDNTPGTNVGQYVGLLRQQAATLDATVNAQRAALEACAR